jgi:hypothetical protein
VQLQREIHIDAHLPAAYSGGQHGEALSSVGGLGGGHELVELVVELYIPTQTKVVPTVNLLSFPRTTFDSSPYNLYAPSPLPQSLPNAPQA